MYIVIGIYVQIANLSLSLPPSLYTHRAFEGCNVGADREGTVFPNVVGRFGFLLKGPPSFFAPCTDASKR